MAATFRGDYEAVASGATASVLGGNGSSGDYLHMVVVIPETTSPGAVSILDNASSTTIFTGGASSVSNLVPFIIPVMAVSKNGPWKVTTGTNVHVLAVGNFT